MLFFRIGRIRYEVNRVGSICTIHEAHKRENKTYDFMTYLKKKPYIMIEMFTTPLIELNSENFFFLLG